MVLKLYAAPDSSKAKRILIAAVYNGISIEAPTDKQQGAEGKMPVLETDEGCIFSTNAIARYVARMRRDTGVYGQTFIESGAIDGWVEFCQHELEVPLCVWVYPKLGIFEEVPRATEQAKLDVAKALTILNKHLESNTFMVGHQVTLADITIACSLLDGFVHVMDKAYREKFPNLVRWFGTCVSQPQFQKVLGTVTMLGDKAAPAPKKADASPKKADASPKAQATPKKEAPKKEEKKTDASPKAAAKEKGKKEPPPPDTPEIAEIKKQLAAKKEALKAAGKKGQEVNKDPEVEALVKKMQALQSGAKPSSPKAAPAPAAAPAGGPDEKELKVIKKEGGKKGSEITGAADMGGMTFMNCSLDSMDLGGKTIGEVDRMVFALNEMNRPVEEGAEEAKGGSGHVAKALFSYGNTKTGVLCYVPAEHQKTVTAQKWCEQIVKGLGGKVLPGATGELAKGEILGNGDKGLFPIKLKDDALQASIQYLVKIGVFPDKDSDSDEMIFGDDDFPS
jgi:glutathione S-transferase